MMQVDTVGAHHIVPIARVGEKVGIGSCIYTCAHKGNYVLKHSHAVVASIDDEQTPTELVCFAKEGSLLITLGV